MSHYVNVINKKYDSKIVKNFIELRSKTRVEKRINTQLLKCVEAQNKENN